MARSAGTGIIFIFGVLLMLWTLLVFAIGVIYYFLGLSSKTETENADAASMMFYCTIFNVVIVTVFMSYWYIRKTKEDKIDALASYLRIHRRTPIIKAAQHLGMDVKSTERLLLECISKGQIQGFLDRRTGEFILEESIADMREGAKCPNCGGYTDTVTLTGEVLNCQFCGSVVPFVNPPPTVPPVPPPVKPPSPPPLGGGRIMLCSGCRKQIPLDSRLCPYCGNKFEN